MKTRILPIPLGSGINPQNYYTKDEVNALIADFITNTVDDLTNYYLKSETLTTAEIQALVGQITSFEVVANLPVSDIKTNVIYLLGPIGTGSDRYEEYIYSNNTWVKIGETSVDLSNYITVTQLNTALGFYTPTAQLATVATSGDYTDLTNKPTIPAAQIQSDWSQSDNSAVDYIKNKPNIPDAVSGTNDGTNWTTLTIGSDTYDIPQGGGGSNNEWYGSQYQFDNLGTYDADTDYYISEINYSEIKDTPNLDNYATKADKSELELDIAGKENNIVFLGTAGLPSIANPQEGVTYAVEGETIPLTFTLADQTTVTYNFVID